MRLLRVNRRFPVAGELMREITVKVYAFSELSDKAKDRARYELKAAQGYPRQDEAIASLQAMAAHFDSTVADYQVEFFDCSYSSATFSVPEMEAEEIARRLEDLGEYDPQTLKGKGEYRLTGVCSDEDIIDGFRAAWHAGERDLNKLLQAGFRTWLKAAQSDCESLYSNEVLAETCEANTWEFYEDGTQL